MDVPRPQIGQRWMRRDGGVTAPLQSWDRRAYPLRDPASGASYTGSGRYSTETSNHPLDLIAPAPSAPAPQGDVERLARLLCEEGGVDPDAVWTWNGGAAVTRAEAMRGEAERLLVQGRALARLRQGETDAE